MNPTPRLLKAIEPSKAIPSSCALSTKAPQVNGSGSSSGAQIASGLPATKKAAAPRFLCRDIKPKKGRVRGPEISQY